MIPSQNKSNCNYLKEALLARAKNEKTFTSKEMHDFFTLVLITDLNDFVICGRS